MANANTIGPATRINGQLEADEDVTVEGRVEGGPVRIRGRLSIAARGIVLAEETEVREALIVGVFVGTLRAQEVVRIHQDGRIVGYSGLDAINARYGDDVLDVHLPDAGTPTQPVEAGYMANAWVRLAHPDYDTLRGMLDDVGRSVRVHAA